MEAGYEQGEEPPACEVAYRVTSQWPGGYVTSVRVRNTSTAVVSPWSVRWTFPDDQEITSGWSGTYAQTGRDVVVTAPSWLPALSPGGDVWLGFTGRSSGTPEVPSAITLNGRTCLPV